MYVCIYIYFYIYVDMFQRAFNVMNCQQQTVVNLKLFAKLNYILM